MSDKELFTHKVTVCCCLVSGLFAGAVPAQIIPLSVRPVASDYSKALDSIVIVSAVPNQLSLWNTRTQALSSIGLALPPTAVSVSPDGRMAAVGHDGRISIVQLSPLNVVQVLNVSCDVLSIVFPSADWVYALPRRDQWTSVRSVQISTGVESQSSGLFYAGTVGKLLPQTTFVYAAQNGIYPDHMQKFDTAGGPIQYLYDWRYHGDYSACGNLWPSPDGLRILTRCGSVFRASTVQSDDMTYNGKLAVPVSLEAAAFSVSKDRILAFNSSDGYSPGATMTGADSLMFFGYQFLNQVASLKIPAFEVLGQKFPGYGRAVFVNAAEDTWFALVQADGSAGLLNDYGIVSGSLDGFVLNAASLSSAVLAPEQIGSLFTDLGAIQTDTAKTNPAPTELSRVQVKFVGSDGIERLGHMLYIGPGQVNFVTPPDIPAGSVKVYVDNMATASRKVLAAQIQSTSPGIFTATGDGLGAPAGLALTIKPGGTQSYSYLFQRNADGTIGPNPVKASAYSETPDTIYLLLFGTGMRHYKTVTASVGNTPVPVAIAAQSETDGLDQVNLGPLPLTSLSMGQLSVVITVDGTASNATTIQLQYQ